MNTFYDGGVQDGDRNRIKWQLSNNAWAIFINMSVSLQVGNLFLKSDNQISLTLTNS